MLNPHTIPSSQPIISVGIILPENEVDSVRLQFPVKTTYELRINNSRKRIKSDSLIEILLNEEAISLSLENEHFSLAVDESIVIIPHLKTAREIHPQSGVLLKNIISGRGFHWKKKIDVYIPGTILIYRKNNHLILINDVYLEEYLMCVATSEMGSASPPALIEAQTIAARSWLLAATEQKHKDLHIDACNDDCCQRYQGTTHLTEQSITGANNTAGLVILYNDKICDARYSKSCGGMTESYHNIWNGSPIPYLSSSMDTHETLKLPDLSIESEFNEWIQSPPETFCSPSIVPEDSLKHYLGSVDETGHYFRWQKKLWHDELTENINRFHKINAKSILDLTPIKRGNSGRIIDLKVVYLDNRNKYAEMHLQSEYLIRQALHKSFLFSSAIIIKKITDHNKDVPKLFKITGAGWGHGAGLCQIGALGMALKGYCTKDILLHYYKDTILKKIY